MKKVFIPLALIMVVILLFTGCGEPEETTTTPTSTTATAPTTTTAAPTPTIKTGGTLRLLSSHSPATMPGWPGNATDFQRIWTNWIVYEALVKLDTEGKPIPWLATDWTFGSENAYIDLNLRDDVEFHDGTKFTAESVVTHVNQLFQDEDKAVRYLDRIEKTGDYSVRIYITEYRIDLWDNQVATWTMFFTSDTQLKEKGLDYVKENLCGTGPFILESYETDVGMRFVKNPNYWQEGKPYLDAIEHIVVKEPLTQQAKMVTEEADVMSLMSDGKILNELSSKGMIIADWYSSSWYLIFGSADEGSPTDDPNVRMALEYAINKQEMADVLGEGYMRPANQLAGPGSPSAYNPNLGSRDFDLAKATQMLADAGHEDGFTLNMIVDIAEPTQQAAAVMIQNYLAAVGITVEIEAVDGPKMWSYLFSGWDGFICMNFGMRPTLSGYLSRHFPPWSAYNASVEFPQDIIDKISAAMVETVPAKLVTMNHELSQWIWDNAFFVPLYFFNAAYVYQPYVRDFGYAEYIDFSQWNPEKCWLDR